MAGRYNEVTFTGNILDANMDMAKVSYGDKIKVSAAAGKAYDSVEVDDTNLLDSDDRIYIGTLEAALGDVDAYVGYFKTNSNMDKEINTKTPVKTAGGQTWHGKALKRIPRAATASTQATMTRARALILTRPPMPNTLLTAIKAGTWA